MNSSRRKFAAILEALGVPPSGRRPVATPAAPACESLEGRQLLASGAGLMSMGLAGLGGMADVSTRSIGFNAPNDSTAPGLPGVDMGSADGTSSQSPALDQLHTDEQAIQDKSLVTPVMEATVRSDISAIKAAETTVPNPAAVAILKSVTQTANANPGGPTDFQAAQVLIAQDVVYNTQGVSTTLTAQLDADHQAIKVASGVTAADEATLTADRAAIQSTSAAMKAAPTTPTTTTAATTTATASTAIPVSTPAMPVSTTGSTMTPGGTGGNGGDFLHRDDFGMGSMGGGMGHGDDMKMMGGWDDSGSMAAGQGSSTASTAAETTLKVDSEKLRTDMQAIHDKSDVTPAMEAVVRNDLMAIDGAKSTAPSATAQATLDADIKAAQANVGGPTDAQQAQITTDKDAVYASEGINTLLIARLDFDQAAVKTTSHVTDADEATLYADRAAVKADFAALAPTTSSTTDSSSTDATTTTSTASTADAMHPDHGFRPMDFGRGGFDQGGFGDRG